jgi:KaiC/GvpD/RAD55 family RecA-like ATPase
MSTDEVLSLLKDFNYHLPPEVREERKQKLLADTSYSPSLLLQLDILPKSTWHFVVEIIRELGYPRNRDALPSLVELMQDINWPGADEAMEIIKGIEKEVTVPIIENAIKEAYSEEDYQWLAGIKRMVKRSAIQKEDFSDETIYELLKFADF